MKIFQTATIVSVSSLILLTTVSFLPAQPRTITFEMGEGGHTVTFPMTEKEIVEYEKRQKTIKAIIANKEQIKPQIISFELPESGITIDFRMSAIEVLRQKQLNKHNLPHTTQEHNIIVYLPTSTNNQNTSATMHSGLKT